MERNEKENKIPSFVYKAIFISSLGGILFGYDLGAISTALPQISRVFGLNEESEEMVVSFLYIGATLGAVLGGWIIDTLGRRKGILITDMIFILGATIIFSSDSLKQLLVGRIILGFAVAVSGVADVAYLTEISPPDYRGSIVSVNEACISLGFLLSFVVGYGINMVNPDTGWKLIFGLGSSIAALQFIGMIFMPESPVWLKEKGRIEEADVNQKKINGEQNEIVIEIIDMHIEEQKHQENNEMKVKDHSTIQADTGLSSSNHSTYSEQRLDDSDEGSGSSSFFVLNSDEGPEDTNEENNSLRSQAEIAIFLVIMQQFCGQINVLNFAPTIFLQLGFEGESLFVTVLLGTVKFICTCCVIWKIESTGRRPLLLGGIGLIAVSMLFLTIAYIGNTGNDSMPTGKKISALIGLFGVVIGYSISFGPLTWLLISEMFPTYCRGRALGISTTVTYAMASLVSYTFLSIQTDVGPSIPFSIYFVLTSISFVFAFIAVPETKEKSPSDIHEILMTMRFWRRRDQPQMRKNKNPIV